MLDYFYYMQSIYIKFSDVLLIIVCLAHLFTLIFRTEKASACSAGPSKLQEIIRHLLCDKTKHLGLSLWSCNEIKIILCIMIISSKYEYIYCSMETYPNFEKVEFPNIYGRFSKNVKIHVPEFYLLEKALNSNWKWFHQTRHNVINKRDFTDFFLFVLKASTSYFKNRLL